MNWSIREMRREDADQVYAIQLDYSRSHPDAELIASEMYLSPLFLGGANVLCAVDDARVLGYAALNANLASGPGVPHTIWARILTTEPPIEEVRQGLLQRASDRGRQMAAAVPGHEARLTFQFYASETEGMSFARSIGCRQIKTGYRMKCDLSKQPTVPDQPEGIQVRATRLETEAEQVSYAAERSEAFPEESLTVAEWQKFLATPLFRGGTTFTAFASDKVIGSVAVFWDPRQRQVAYTEYIFVKRGWRRRGIASFLIARALAHLKERGLAEAHLDVDSQNADALSVYRRLGYFAINEHSICALTL